MQSLSQLSTLSSDTTPHNTRIFNLRQWEWFCLLDYQTFPPICLIISHYLFFSGWIQAQPRQRSWIQSQPSIRDGGQPRRGILIIKRYSSNWLINSSGLIFFDAADVLRYRAADQPSHATSRATSSRYQDGAYRRSEICNKTSLAIIHNRLTSAFSCLKIHT